MDRNSKMMHSLVALIAVAALVCAIVALALRNRLSDDSVKRQHLAVDSVGSDELDEGHSYEMQNLRLNGTLQEYRLNVEDITGAKTLTADDSGKSFTVAAAAAYTITLPAVANGLYYKFTARSVPVGAVTITAGSAILYSVIFDGTGVLGTGADSALDTSIAFGTAAEAGDHVEIFCNGTNWFARAFTYASDGVTTA